MIFGNGCVRVCMWAPIAVLLPVCVPWTSSARKFKLHYYIQMNQTNKVTNERTKKNTQQNPTKIHAWWWWTSPSVVVSTTIATATVLVKFLNFCIAHKAKKTIPMRCAQSILLISFQSFPFCLSDFRAVVVVLDNIEHSIFYQFRLIWQVESFYEMSTQFKDFALALALSARLEFSIHKWKV